MKHAFLIIAHGNWEQLKILLKQIDQSNHYIYIHIDLKVKNVPIKEIISVVKESHIKIYQKYKVFWGSFELVETELFLLNEAYNDEKFDYFHLLSGMDMLIKDKKTIDSFFEKNNGKEFVHFDTEERLKTDKEIYRRTACYHFFTNYRKRYKIKIFNAFFSNLERMSLLVQTKILKINRQKKYPEFIIKYGSQWFSITNKLVEYILSQKTLVYKIFTHTKCADELFIQSLVFNSKFKYNLYDASFSDRNEANMRLLDIKVRGKDGSPYVWKIKDFDEIANSNCLFARKFNLLQDEKIVEKVYQLTM